KPSAAWVEVVALADEEVVRFASGLIGSFALTGELDNAKLGEAHDWRGVPIDQVLAAAGREVDRLVDAHQHLAAIAGFLELHIEQGPRMEAAGTDLALATRIVAVQPQPIPP